MKFALFHNIKADIEQVIKRLQYVDDSRLRIVGAAIFRGDKCIQNVDGDVKFFFSEVAGILRYFRQLLRYLLDVFCEESTIKSR